MSPHRTSSGADLVDWALTSRVRHVSETVCVMVWFCFGLANVTWHGKRCGSFHSGEESDGASAGSVRPGKTRRQPTNHGVAPLFLQDCASLALQRDETYI